MNISKNGFTLVRRSTGLPVDLNSTHLTSDGEDLYRLEGGDPKVHNPASSGCVWVTLVDEDGEAFTQREFYPQVLGLEWVRL